MNAADSPILQQVAKYLSDTLQMELLNGYPHPYVASKALFNSIESVVSQTMSSITITTQGLYYAKYVNAGRKAGEKGIPLDVLVEWIRRRKVDLRGKREKSVAFAIQASIKKWGIDPTNFIDNAELKLERSGVVDEKIGCFMEKYIDDILQNMFNQLSA